MLSFLFWNLKRNHADLLTSLVHHHSIDFVIVAESPMSMGTVLSTLNRTRSDYHFIRSGSFKLQVYGKYSDQFVLPVEGLPGSQDISLLRLCLPARLELLLAAVHLPSKLRQSSQDQSHYSTHVAQLLARAESRVGHKRSILVGDLNMNPYEDGVMLANGLHAVMTRRLALRETRRVKFESNTFFYNPMWSHFGERKEGHAGTYYYSTPKSRADFWNVYDQVLVRPALLPFFRDEDVQVIWRDLASGTTFIDSEGRPKANEISDHLPILFKLDL